MTNNTKLKKVTASALTIGMVLTTLSPTMSFAASKSFKDVPASDSGYSAIMSLAEKGIIAGYSDGTYKPDANLSKVEALKIILGITSKNNLANIDSQKSGYSTYNDVPESQWYTSLVNFAKENGVITSNVQNTSSEFGKDDKITRAEFITLFVNAFGVKTVTQADALKGTKFADIKYNPSYHWSAPAAYAMEKYLKYVNGYSDTKFGPGNNITRREVAFIMNRYFSNPENFKNVELKTTASKLLDSSVLTMLKSKGTKVSTSTTTDETPATDTNTGDDFNIDFGNILDESDSTDTNTDSTDTNTDNTDTSTDSTNTNTDTTDNTNTTVSDDVSKLMKQETLSTTSLVQNSISNIFELTLSAPTADVKYDNFVVALAKQNLLGKDNFDRLYVTDENDVPLTRDSSLVSDGTRDKVTLRALDSKGIEVKKGTTKKVKVKVITEATMSTGSAGKFELLTVGVNGAEKTVNFVTPNLSTVGVDVGQVVVSLDAMTPSNSSLDVGTTDQILAVYKFTNNSTNSSVKLKSLVLDQGGSIDSEKVTNVKAVLGDKSFTATMSTVDNDKFKLTFDSDFTLKKGESKILIIKGDLVGGAGRTVQFKITDKYDIIAESGNYAGYFINPVTNNTDKSFSTVSSSTLGTFTLNTGNLQVTKSTSSATGEIPRGATEIDLASFDIQPTGESSKLNSITLVKGAGTAWPAGKPIQNVKVLLEGQIVGSLGTMDLEKDSEFTIDLDSDYEVKLNEIKKLTIAGDITSEVTKGSKVQLGLSRVESTGVESDDSIVFTSTGEYANTLTINNNTLLVNKDEGVKTSYIVKGARQKELGAVKVAVGNVEDLVLTSIKLKTSTVADIQNLQNIKLYLGDKQIGTTITTPSAGINEITGIAKTIKKSETLVFTIKGDVKQGATTDQNVTLLIPADGLTFVGVNSASTLQSPVSDTITFDTFTIKSGGSISSVSIESAGEAGKDKIITPSDGSVLVWKGKIVSDSIEGLTFVDLGFFDKKATDNRVALKEFTLKLTGLVDANGNTTTYTKTEQGGLAEVSAASTMNFIKFDLGSTVKLAADSAMGVELYAKVNNPTGDKSAMESINSLIQFGIHDMTVRGTDSGNYVTYGTDISNSSYDSGRGTTSGTVVLAETSGIKVKPLLTKPTLKMLSATPITSTGTDKALFSFDISVPAGSLDVKLNSLAFNDINSSLDGIALKNVKLKDITDSKVLVSNNGRSFNFTSLDGGAGVKISAGQTKKFTVLGDITGVSKNGNFSVKFNKGTLGTNGDINWNLLKNTTPVGTTMRMIPAVDSTGEAWDSDTSSVQILNFSSLDSTAFVPSNELDTLVVSTATTKDIDDDGELEQIELTFNQNLIDSKSTTASNYTISGVTGVTVDSISTGTGDDNKLTLNLSGFTANSTGLTPTVNIKAGGVESAYTTNATIGKTATDSAKPLFVTTVGANNQGVGTGVVTLKFSESIFNNVADLATLKGQIQLATDGTTFGALAGGDAVTSLSGDTIVITFATPLTGATNKIKIAVGSIKDSANNTNAVLTSPVITIN